MIFYSKATGGFYDSAIHGDKIPADRIEITAKEHSELLEGQSAGKRIQADTDGRPVLFDPPAIPISERRTRAKTAIDAAAGNARARFVSTGQLVEEEYRLALQQTQAWRFNGSPADAVPPAIRDWADADGITPEQAAVSIEQTSAGWEIVLLTVRQLRLAGKAAVDASADTADFDAVAKVYIDQLDAMKP